MMLTNIDARFAPILRERTRTEIDTRVARLLADVGVTGPPCPLSIVHDFLKLDVSYYRSDDPSLLAETVHRLRLASAQVARNPMRIVDAIRKWELSALWLPDKRRILVDAVLPPSKHRWREAHETGHSILPWHESFSFGDNSKTLSVACHSAIEAEANYAAGGLLFLQDRFLADALDRPIGMKAVRELKATYGNSLTTTLWRYVERAHRNLPMLAMVASATDEYSNGGIGSVRHIVRSPAFIKSFGSVGPAECERVVAAYAVHRRGGTLGMAQSPLTDDAGVNRGFVWETFSNTHDALTLAFSI
jgi:Zn-dependent peptidase ImmA (M78 family)